LLSKVPRLLAVGILTAWTTPNVTGSRDALAAYNARIAAFRWHRARQETISQAAEGSRHEGAKGAGEEQKRRGEEEARENVVHFVGGASLNWPVSETGNLPHPLCFLLQIQTHTIISNRSDYGKEPDVRQSVLDP